MKSVNKYTQVLLTIITLCLLFNVAKDLKIIQVAQAQNYNNVIDVNIKSVGNQYVYDGKIPVKN